MKVYNVLEEKGGTSKSTTVQNLAYGLSRKGYRVLVIDLDPQANTTGILLRVAERLDPKSIAEVLSRNADVDDPVQAGMILVSLLLYLAKVREPKLVEEMHAKSLEMGIKEDEMRLRDHAKEELSFYSKATTDIEFLFPFGWGELWGIADRTDYDLSRHMEVSGQDLTFFDETKKEKYIPYVIEPSLGADRVVLAFLCSAYDEENIGTEEKPDVRTVLHFHPAIAPVKVGVLPLSKKLAEPATKIYEQLSKYWNCEYDDRGNIGKRYRRQDEIGTPFCVTYDFDSQEDGCVTVRDRDTMEQQRIKIEELVPFLTEKIDF